MKKFREREKYGHGGDIDDKKAMILSQIKEVHHHADELEKVLANMDTVDAWVVGKMERATTDLSDITHYLDGTTEYAKGGKIGDIGKSGTQYGYTLKEWEGNAEKIGLLVSPKEWWKNQQGKKYKDFFGRTKTIGHFSQDERIEMNYYGYQIAIGMDLGSKKIPKSAIKYVEDDFYKMADGGELTENAEIEIVKNEDGVFKVYYTKGDIGFDGRLRRYHSGRDYEYEFEPDSFDDDKSEEYYYNDGDGVIENEILDVFYSKLGTMADGGMMAKGGSIKVKAWLVDEEDGLPKVIKFASVEKAKRNQIDVNADDPYYRPLFTSIEDLKEYLSAQYFGDAEDGYPIFNNNRSRYEVMAKGGKVKYDYLPKYEIESINTWDGENIEEKDILDGAYVKKSRKR